MKLINYLGVSMTALLLTGLPATAQSVFGGIMSKTLFVSKYGYFGLFLAALVLFFVFYVVISLIEFEWFNYVAWRDDRYVYEAMRNPWKAPILRLVSSMLWTAFIFLIWQ